MGRTEPARQCFLRFSLLRAVKALSYAESTMPYDNGDRSISSIDTYSEPCSQDKEPPLELLCRL